MTRDEEQSGREVFVTYPGIHLRNKGNTRKVKKRNRSRPRFKAGTLRMRIISFTVDKKVYHQNNNTNTCRQ